MGAAEVLLGDTPLFAPAPTDLIGSMIAEYQMCRAQIDEVAELLGAKYSGVMHHFVAGNGGDHGAGISYGRAMRLFETAGAIASLNASFWSRALRLTDVYDAMPQTRRDEWNKSIMEHTTPEFTDDSVRATLAQLLASRERFFAEKVDGVFEALSGSHVTNRPEGFSKRMIIENAINKGDGHPSYRVAGVIDDLRFVIAKFGGVTLSNWNASSSALYMAMDQIGQWLVLDGGAVRLRVYKAGTVHLEVHSEIAWRLNAILAHLYPHAIPAALRSRPRKAPTKEFALRQCDVAFGVRQILDEALRKNQRSPREYWVAFYDQRKDERAEALRVLELLGAEVDTRCGDVVFDYDARQALAMVVSSGCIPEQVSHQFYETREPLARELVDLADIGDDDLCLEPNAGRGGIAKYMPGDRTRCVEINPLFAKMLEGMGFPVRNEDFLAYAASTTDRFDRVVMNPPFQGGRWKLHVQAAATLLRQDGVIAAIVPTSAKTADPLPGYQCEWHGPYEQMFADTQIPVLILIARK